MNSGVGNPSMGNGTSPISGICQMPTTRTFALVQSARSRDQRSALCARGEGSIPDTMVVRDIWISGSGFNGSYGKALIENHDKLTLLRLVGVPTPVAGHDSRWIDNGPGTGQPEGLLVVRDCRFGGEAGGMTIIVNRMSYLCMHQPANCSACRPTCLPPPG